jgi:inorganic pyrophosphatase
MPKKLKKRSGAMADPTQIKPLRKNDLVRVVVETPKGSRNKYAFDAQREVFTLKRVLPAGMAFPYDFGFVPQTEAEDGDPLDVLLLMEEPAFPGCVIDCRLIGMIEGEQQEKDGTGLNGRDVTRV